MLLSFSTSFPMAFALLYPDPEKGGRGKRLSILNSLEGSKEAWKVRLSAARIVLRFSRDLAYDVMDAKIGLDEAHDKARDYMMEKRLAATNGFLLGAG
jgi:hypothetical protein